MKNVISRKATCLGYFFFLPVFNKNKQIFGADFPEERRCAGV